MQEQVLTQLGAALVQGSLTDEALLAETEAHPVLPILPDANVIKIGGQSFIDRGRAAVFPLLDEIVANLAHHKMIIGTGAGTRARHAYSVGLDLGMPTGVLSILGTFVSMQNARMLHYLLAKHGIPFIEPVQFAQLPFYLEERRAVIFFGMPPYIYWQPNPAIGRIPPHRSDAGSYLLAECFGCATITLIKDVDGLYERDPKEYPRARFIDEITVAELRERDLPTLPFDRALIGLLGRARLVTRIQIINGLEPDRLAGALRGERVGTIVRKDESS